MAAGSTEPLRSEDVLKTYRYLRIGMLGAVVLLAVSVVIEHSTTRTDCWQTSISAYYYTPVRAIFVGSMFAVGLSLIVYKGRTALEDACLNFAGMLAPVVAVAPTTDVGRCWSVPPSPLPSQVDGALADWVVTNINNNFTALLIAGFIGLGVAFGSALAIDRRAVLARPQRGTWVSLGFAFLVMLFGWWLIENWGDFYRQAHGWAALLMFVFLIGAVGSEANEHRRERSKRLFRVYTVVALLMFLGGGIIFFWGSHVFGDYRIFWLEAYEIVGFFVYWLVQTAEKWHEKVVRVQSGAGGG